MDSLWNSRSIVRQMKRRYGIPDSDDDGGMEQENVIKENSEKARRNWAKLRDYLFTTPLQQTKSQQPTICGLYLDKRIPFEGLGSFYQLREIGLFFLASLAFEFINYLWETCSLRIPDSRLRCQFMYWMKSADILHKVGHLAPPIGPSTSTVGRVVGVFTNKRSGGVISLEYSCQPITPPNTHHLDRKPTSLRVTFHACSWGFRYTRHELLPAARIRLFTMTTPLEASKIDNDDEEGHFTNRVRCNELKRLLQTGHYPPSLISFSEDETHKSLLLMIAWKCHAWLYEMPVHELFLAKPVADSVVDILTWQSREGCTEELRWLHEYYITAVMCFDPLELLITADCKGSIKTWDMNFNQLSLLEGHLEAVQHLSPHPLNMVSIDVESTENFIGFVSLDAKGHFKSWKFTKWSHLDDPSMPEFRVKTVEHTREDQTISVEEVDSRRFLSSPAEMRLGTVSPSTRRTFFVLSSMEDKSLSLIGTVLPENILDAKSFMGLRMERWSGVQLSHAFARFPDSIRQLSVAYVRDENSSSIHPRTTTDPYEMVVLVICGGNPGSVHLMRLPRGDLLTTATCDDYVIDAVWHWTTDRLFLLKSNGSLAIFSSKNRPCSLMYEWLAAGQVPEGVQYSGPIHLYRTTYPECLGMVSKDTSNSHALKKPLLLPLVGCSDGSICILCPERGVVWSRLEASNHASKIVDPSSSQKERPILSITSDWRHNRLITTYASGTVQSWQGMNPLPLEVDQQGWDCGAPKVTHQVYLKCCPFILLPEPNLFCLYTTPMNPKNCLMTPHSNICVEYSTRTGLLVHQFETTDPLQPHLLLDQEQVVKAVCLKPEYGDAEPVCSNDGSLLFDSDERTFATVCRGSPGTPLTVCLWHALVGHPLGVGSTAHLDRKWFNLIPIIGFDNDVDEREEEIEASERDLRQKTTKYRKPVNHIAKNVICQLRKLCTVRLPMGVSDSERIDRFQSSLLFTSSCGDFLLAIDDRIYQIQSANLVGSQLVFRRRLVELVQPGLQRACLDLPDIEYTVNLEPRPWDCLAVKLLTSRTKKLVCEVQQLRFSSKQYDKFNRLTRQTREQFHTKLQQRDVDIKRLMEGVQEKQKRKKIADRHEVMRIKETAMENYMSDFMYKSGLKPRRLLQNNESDEPILELGVLEDHLDRACEEQMDIENTLNMEKLQKQQVRKAKLEAKKKKKSKKSKKKKKSVSREEEEEKEAPLKADGDFVRDEQCWAIVPVPEKDTIEAVDTEDREWEWRALPYQRSYGFFAHNVLQETGFWKHGWVPNSCLIQARCPERFKSEEDESSNVEKWTRPNLDELQRRLDQINAGLSSNEVSLITSSSSGWLIGSDKEDSLDQQSGETAENLLEKRLMKNPEELLQPDSLPSDEEDVVNKKTDTSADQTTALQMKENMMKSLLVRKKESQEDLLAHLDEEGLKRPKGSKSFGGSMDDESTVFLTEVRGDQHLKLPKFLRPYSETNWFQVLLASTKPSKNVYSTVDTFVRWLINVNFFSDVLHQKSPPCPSDGNGQLCPITVELFQAIGSLHIQYGLSYRCTEQLREILIEHCVRKKAVFGKQITVMGISAQVGGPSWPLLWASISLLISLGYNDVDTICLVMATHFLLEAIRQVDAAYATEKQLLLLSALDHAGRKDPKNAMSREMLELFRGRNVVNENNNNNPSLAVLPESQTTLESWVVGRGNDEFYWSKAVGLARDWLNHWVQVTEAEKAASLEENRIPSPRRPNLLRRGSLDRKPPPIQRGQSVTWADQRQEAQSNASDATSKSVITGIDAINTFCLYLTRPRPKVTGKVAQKWQKLSETAVSNRGLVTLKEGEPLDHMDGYDVEEPVRRVVKRPIRNETNPEVLELQSLRDSTQPAWTQPWKAYKNALEGNFPPYVQLRPPKCTLLPFSENGSRADLLWERFIQFQRWKARIDAMSYKRRYALLQKPPRPGTFDGLLFDEKYLRYYEQMLTYLVLEENQMFQGLNRLFIPGLSRVLPPVETWKLPALTLHNVNEDSGDSTRSLALWKKPNYSKSSSLSDLNTTRKDISVVRLPSIC